VILILKQPFYGAIDFFRLKQEKMITKSKYKKATLSSGFLCLVGGLYKELGFEPLPFCSTLSKSALVKSATTGLS
jgi:hypothetical protein